MVGADGIEPPTVTDSLVCKCLSTAVMASQRVYSVLICPGHGVSLVSVSRHRLGSFCASWRTFGAAGVWVQTPTVCKRSCCQFRSKSEQVVPGWFLDAVATLL